MMMRMCAAAFAAAALVCAQDGAAFTGSWVMNKAKSDFGAMPEQMVPDKLSMKVVGSAAELRTVSTQVGARGESTAEALYKLDGKTENVNKAMGGELKTVAKWDGEAIVLVSNREVQGMALTITQRMAKGSADVILMETKVGGTPMGEIVMKYHLDRVAEAAAAPAAAQPSAAAPASAPAVSYNGTWKMNKAKSSFGALPEEFQPSSVVRVVEHDAAQALVKSHQTGAQGELKIDLKLKLDGSESVNNLGDGEGRSVAKWDGEALTVVTKREFQGSPLTIRERWTKVDAKTMNVDTTIADTPIGDIVLKYVFEKE